MTARSVPGTCLTALLACTVGARAEAQALPPVPAPADRAAVEACLRRMPAGVQLAVALVHGDAVRFLGAERTADGVARIDNRSAVFQIGSMTKVFTATLLAQAVTAGTLRLDDAVAGLVPFRLAASGRGGVEMTLVQLASHTAGVAHHQPPGLGRHALLHLHPNEPWRDYDRARFQRYLEEDLELVSTPGTAYLYSNIGMSLLGLVLAERTGRPYEAMLQDGICRPLGMTGTTTDLAAVRDRVVPGLKTGGTRFPNQFMAALTPAGGIYSSAEDLARLARTEIAATDPAIALSQRPVFTIAEGERVALGWHVYDWAQGWRTLNHNGGIGGYTSSLYVDTANQCAAAVLSNVMNEGEFGEAVRALARTLLQQLEAPVAAAGPEP